MYRYQLSRELVVRPLDQEVALFNRETDNIHLISLHFFTSLQKLEQQCWRSLEDAAGSLAQSSCFEPDMSDEMQHTLKQMLQQRLIICDEVG